MSSDAGARYDSKQEACSEVAKRGHWRGLTFDMSGSLKRAKRALGCPLDGRVGRLVEKRTELACSQLHQ